MPGTALITTERSPIRVAVKPSASTSASTTASSVSTRVSLPSVTPTLPLLPSSSPSPSVSLLAGHYSMQGVRAEMEDKVVLLPHPAFNEVGDIGDAVPRSFFAVFDGHGGDVSAEYCRQHVHLNFLSDQAFTSDESAALRSALVRTDADFCAACRRIHLVSSSGTTALCAFLKGAALTVANIGDSRGVLVRKTSAVPVSNDHKPGRIDERARIEKCGGRVGITEEESYSGRLPSCLFFASCFPSSRPLRVFPGGLSVSRTIGDIGMKSGGLIIAEPELFTCTLTADDCYLVLACDGVWDVVSNTAIADLCRKHAQLEDMDEMARIIAKEAFRRGSTDNISVIVVQFHWDTKSDATKQPDHNAERKGS